MTPAETDRREVFLYAAEAAKDDAAAPAQLDQLKRELTTHVTPAGGAP